MFGSLAAADLFNRGGTSFPCPERPKDKVDETLSCRPLCLMCLSNKLCAGLNVYERRARERARETEKIFFLAKWVYSVACWYHLANIHIYMNAWAKNNVCLICLNVYPSINSQSVNSLRMTAFVCVSVCGMHVCGWVMWQADSKRWARLCTSHANRL